MSSLLSKKCACCFEVKTSDLFSKDNKRKDGINVYCKSCAAIKKKAYRDKNKDIINQKSRQYYIDNREKCIESKKKWSSENKDYYKKYNSENKERINELYNKRKHRYVDNIKSYYLKNKEKISEYHKKYRLDNKEKINKRIRSYRKNRLVIDSVYFTKIKVTRLVRESFKRRKSLKNTNTEEILGCSYDYFKSYMEKMFSEGMSWSNYGYDGWHIDHIIPLSTAKTKSDVIKLNHHTNLQPLWKEDNFKKGCSIV